MVCTHMEMVVEGGTGQQFDPGTRQTAGIGQY